MIRDSIFLEIEFFLLINFSVLLPGVCYGFMMLKKAISRTTVFLFALLLVLLSGVDVVLLQKLATLARQSPAVLTDQLFLSEVSLALYLLPLVSAGIGINLLSHLLINHLNEAESRFEREHENDEP
jgi:hypothetical protein